jgi:hypothetical protein
MLHVDAAYNIRVDRTNDSRNFAWQELEDESKQVNVWLEWKEARRWFLNLFSRLKL